MKNKYLTPILIGLTLITGIVFLRNYNLNQLEKNKKEDLNSTSDQEVQNIYQTKEWQENATRAVNSKPGEVYYTDKTFRRSKTENTNPQSKLTTTEISLLLNTVEYKRKAHYSAVDYLKRAIPIAHPECKLISSSPFSPSRVKYFGNRVYNINLIITFECDQSYTNRFLFKIKAVYNTNTNTWGNQILRQEYL